MTATVFLAVLFAAILHAGWNALVKGGADKVLAMAAVVIGHVPFAVAAVLWAPLPAVESLPWLATGVALHLGYQLFLLQAYRIGDLSQVYPIARGAAPLIVALVSVTALGVHLTGQETLAIAIIATGILSLALTRRADGLRNGKAAMLALVTGVFIASYSLVDGIGARAAGTSLGYYAWLALANAVLTSLWVGRYHPGTLRALAGRGQKMFWVGGGASFAAYAIVTWAFTQAPIALVTALRETSIVFALLLGVLALGERLSLGKLFSTFTTLAGAALLRAAKS